MLKVILSFCYLFLNATTQSCIRCRGVRIRSGTGWGGRWSQAAHAQSVGKAIENAELCRAVRKASWTPPLGTTAGAPEVSGTAAGC